MSEDCHVLVLCTHNAARSILAEAMLGHWAVRLGRRVRGHSAGSAPAGRVHPLALEVLRRAGIATETCRSKSWDEFARAEAPPLALVVTVCDGAAAEACPLFRGRAGEGPLRAHWSTPDPSLATGDEAARRAAFERTRLALGTRVRRLLERLPAGVPDRAALQAALAATADD